jgi:hypothetical protein
MPIVRSFIHRSSVQVLQEFLNKNELSVKVVDWKRDQSSVVSSVNSPCLMTLVDPPTFLCASRSVYH